MTMRKIVGMQEIFVTLHKFEALITSNHFRMVPCYMGLGTSPVRIGMLSKVHYMVRIFKKTWAREFE